MSCLPLLFLVMYSAELERRIMLTRKEYSMAFKQPCCCKVMIFQVGCETIALCPATKKQVWMLEEYVTSTFMFLLQQYSCSAACKVEQCMNQPHLPSCITNDIVATEFHPYIHQLDLICTSCVTSEYCAEFHPSSTQVAVYCTLSSTSAHSSCNIYEFCP